MSPRKPVGVVLISNSQRAVRVYRKRLAELVGFVARKEGHRLGQIDIAVAGRAEMSRLNREWLGDGRATDVLSFDLTEGGGAGICAQIVVCGELAAEQARLRGLRPQRELMLYVVHGLLHLMGCEDATVRGAAKMHAREDELLDGFLGRRRPVRPSSSSSTPVAARPSRRRRV